MTGTEIIFMTFLIIVALVATSLLCMALYEFIRTIREDRKLLEELEEMKKQLEKMSSINDQSTKNNDQLSVLQIN